MQVTLEKVFTKVKETKRGPALSVGLKVTEDVIEDINGEKVTIGDRWINSFFPEDYTFPHEEGEQVEILVVQNGDYLNFKLPGVGKAPTPDVSALVERIKKLEDAVFNSAAPVEPEPVDPDDF